MSVDRGNTFIKLDEINSLLLHFWQQGQYDLRDLQRAAGVRAVLADRSISE